MTLPRDPYELRLSGSGGQGLLLSGRILAEALMRRGLTVAQSQSYEPTSRGGLSRADLVIASAEVDYPLVTALDAVVILDHCAAGASTALMRPGALVLADRQRVPEPPERGVDLRRLPLIETARDAGSERVANLVALGALLTLTHLCPLDAVEAAMTELSPAEFRMLNRTALRAGAALAG